MVQVRNDKQSLMLLMVSGEKVCSVSVAAPYIGLPATLELQLFGSTQR